MSRWILLDIKKLVYFSVYFSFEKLLQLSSYLKLMRSIFEFQVELSEAFQNQATDIFLNVNTPFFRTPKE